MELREADASDSEDVADVARASLAESYGHFVDEETIDHVVDDWYAQDRVDDLVGDQDVVLEVAEVDDAVVGFAQGATVQSDPIRGELHWLHVTPSSRGRGIGIQLFGRVEELFADRGAATIRGLVLADNEEGVAFYEDQGFDEVGSATVDVGDQSLEELVFERPIGDAPEEQVVDRIDGPDDGDLFVNYSEAERGLRAPFYPAYENDGLEDRYGWFCGDCESVDNAMDSMGRIVCNDCGNERKATRWDGAYL